jgi:CubicO group peptidase (beta-lactamase class C family)
MMHARMSIEVPARVLVSTALLLLFLPAARWPVLSEEREASRHARAIAEARATVQQIVAEGRAPGIGVAVALGGNIVWSEGFGFADLEHRVPVSDDTRFGLGSISKTLTMTAAVRLMERGLLDLDAPVERYLADWPHKGRGVTIRRLAAHQSGLSDAFASEHYATTRHFATIDDAYQEIKTGRIDYTPGSRTEYATGVYTVIGKVLEAVAHRDYRQIMREEVFEPSGAPGIVQNDRRSIVLHRTGFYANREGGGFEHGAFFDPSHKLPGAGYLATARELATFGAALLRPGLLGDNGRQELFRAVPLSDGTATEFALGLRVSADTFGPLFHQPGGGIGISSWLFIHPEAGLVVALLSNVNTAPVGGRTHRRIAEAFLKR